ncbi:HET-domain-containing protein [Hypoxylon cercidicola]|nr:HET-domain-containing protein [Hypoxylon cercidicola]
MPSKQQICDRCLELNLAAFFESDYANTTVMKEYHIPIQIPEKQLGLTDCALCNILSRSEFYDLPGETDEESRELRAIDLEWVSPPGKYNGEFLVLIICSRSFARWMQALSISKCIFGMLMQENGCIILERTAAPKMKIPSAKFNAQQTLNWISECKHHIKTICHPLRRPIRDHYLVDCYELAVVAARESYQYVALSYVWGPLSDDKVYNRNNDTHLLPDNLPLVITDAIAVTKSLGFRYLWIDKFCITQDQPEVKHRQIADMDAIYANSELTIVAAAGQDGNYGLPGVSSRLRVATPVVEVGEFRVLWFQNPLASIRESKWHTRGWTYQEAFLARRRLVFLDDQTFFECGTAEHCEMIQGPPSLRDMFSNWKFKKTGPWEPPVRRRLHELFEYLNTILGDYTKRELRYDSDSLLALAGILRHLRTSPSDLRHVWGIPWDIEIDAPDDGRDHQNKTWFACDVFVAGLFWSHVHNCWESSGKPRRRSMTRSSGSPSPIPPTWTWAGWDGHVEFDTYIQTHASGLRMRPRQFWLEDQHGHRSAVSAVAQSTLNECFRYPILFIETWAVLPDKIHFREKPDGSVDWDIHGHKAILVCLSEGAGSEPELAKNLKDIGGRWQCILLGVITSWTGRPISVILLILRKEVDGNLWLRVGIMILECHAPDMVELAEELPYPPEEFRIK